MGIYSFATFILIRFTKKPYIAKQMLIVYWTAMLLIEVKEFKSFVHVFWWLKYFEPLFLSGNKSRPSWRRIHWLILNFMKFCTFDNDEHKYDHWYVLLCEFWEVSFGGSQSLFKTAPSSQNGPSGCTRFSLSLLFDHPGEGHFPNWQQFWTIFEIH